MDDPWRGRILDDRYRVLERLATGGMGVVYRGERLGLDKPVAIKFLHQNAMAVDTHRRRFAREAAAMSRLTHPNLVSVIDAGMVEDAPYLVMEFHPGVTLRRVLRVGRLGGGRSAFIARQMLAGLSSAHTSGVIHRDLKPANVLLVGQPGEDLVKILDFGLAKLLEDGGGRSEISVAAAHLPGTPEYMSPEQAEAKPVDARSDLYALGVILYEMAVGRRPFEAEDAYAILRQHVEDEPDPPRAVAPELSSAFEAVILRLLHKDRAARFQSAGEAGAALAATPEGRQTPPFAPPRPADPLAPLSRAGVMVELDRAPTSITDAVTVRRRAPQRRPPPLVRLRFIVLLVAALAASAGYLAFREGYELDLEPYWPSWLPGPP